MISPILLARLREGNVDLAVDGDELVVRRVGEGLDPELIALLRENKAGLLELLRSGTYAAFVAGRAPLIDLSDEERARVEAGVDGGADNVQDVYPLAPLQEGILFHHLLTGEGDPYLLSSLFDFERREQLDAYLGALQAVIDRHDILRTAVQWEGLPEPVQVVWRRAPLRVEEVELDAAEGDAAEALWARFDARHARMDVRRAPLMRAYVAQGGSEGRWLVLLQQHHLVIDHASMEVLQEEIRAHLKGREAELPPPLPFRDFVARTRLGVSPAEHEAFFRAMLADVEAPTVAFGVLDARGDGTGISDARLRVDAALSRRVRARVQALGVSAASVFHLAWALVLARVSGREDVVFGTVLFGRMGSGAGGDRVMGMLINTLPVRIGVGAEGAAAAVRSTHALLAGLLRHEHASLALAQRCSGVAAPAPLFTSLLNYRHSGRKPRSREAGQAREGKPRAGGQGLRMQERTNYPVGLAVDDQGDEFSLEAQVAAPAEAERVCRMMHTALERLVDALEVAPGRAVRSIDVLPAAERRLVLEEWGRTEAASPSERCIHALFEAQARRTPGAPAVVHGEEAVTYAELDARANRLAHRLVGMGAGPEVRVAVCLERSAEMVAAVLAVLKAGAAYLPLDPAYPADRLAYMLADSGARVLVTSSSLGALLPAEGVRTVRVDADAAEIRAEPDTAPRAAVAGENAAYVIYTSGSTGRPKGVVVTHANAASLLPRAVRTFGAEAGDAVLQAVSMSFDASLLEIFVALLSGAALHVAGREVVLSPERLAALLREREIGVWVSTPALLESLPEADFPALRTISTGGERCSAETAARWSRGRRLVNMYGPTETTIYTTAHECAAGAAEAPPIGRPVEGARACVLDARGEPAPVGVAGELYVGGAGVARGYLGRPALTAERFVPDPFGGEAGARLYRTGDRVRWRAGGELEYLGRLDDQVKIRGVRIEPGEVEARLREHEGVREAVVMAREDAGGEKRLVAWFVAGGPVEAESLRTHLAERLPEHMVPAAYVRLEALPLTASGKLDRGALPAPGDGAYARRAYEAPSGDTEEALAEIWSEVLGVERVGRRDDFFALGGHSLLLVQVVSRIREALGVEVALGAFFEHPVFAALADHVLDLQLARFDPETLARLSGLALEPVPEDEAVA